MAMPYEELGTRQRLSEELKAEAVRLGVDPEYYAANLDRYRAERECREDMPDPVDFRGRRVARSSKGGEGAGKSLEAPAP